VNGLFYGVTYQGGTHKLGTVFSITPSGAETVPYSFGATSSDAAYPAGTLIFVNGLLYGASTQGGTGSCIDSTGCGTVFSVSPNGAENVVYAFSSTEGQANANFALLSVGDLFYGVNPNEKFGCGYIYSLTPQGVLTDLHDFAKDGSEGCGPSSPLLDVDGVLYGTTFGGAINDAGTLYSLKP
jgi:uncharacterized repeat protein (TIGR03803 family)